MRSASGPAFSRRAALAAFVMAHFVPTVSAEVAAVTARPAWKEEWGLNTASTGFIAAAWTPRNAAKGFQREAD